MVEKSDNFIAHYCELLAVSFDLLLCWSIQVSASINQNIYYMMQWKWQMQHCQQEVTWNIALSRRCQRLYLLLTADTCFVNTGCQNTWFHRMPRIHSVYKSCIFDKVLSCSNQDNFCSQSGKLSSHGIFSPRRVLGYTFCRTGNWILTWTTSDVHIRLWSHENF